MDIITQIETMREQNYRANLRTIQKEVGPCRENLEDGTRCNESSEYVLWGKLLNPEALGPRCYDHAAKYVGHRSLSDPAYALIDLKKMARRLS